MLVLFCAHDLYLVVEKCAHSGACFCARGLWSTTVVCFVRCLYCRRADLTHFSDRL